jgi:hypothetical protein
VRPVAILPVIYRICRCKIEMQRPIGAALVAVGRERVLSVEGDRARMLRSTALESISMRPSSRNLTNPSQGPSAQRIAPAITDCQKVRLAVQ